MLTVLCGMVLGASGALVWYLFTHNYDNYEALEREVARIRLQGARGWPTTRIRRLHPRFCECQIEYLCGRRRHTV